MTSEEQEDAFFADAFDYLEKQIAASKALIVVSEDALKRYREMWAIVQGTRKKP